MMEMGSCQPREEKEDGEDEEKIQVNLHMFRHNSFDDRES
jgi:hypothetical protein